MKKLGIIGGAGPLASALFYETLIQESYRLARPLPEILLLNYPFKRGLTLKESQENGKAVREELSQCIEALESAQVATGILVCNTLHLELAKISHGKIQFLRIPDLVLAVLKKQKRKRLLLLATQNTCASFLYQREGITLKIPSRKGQQIVDGVIDAVLEGRCSKEGARAIEEVIAPFANEIDGVILGCTDLPVLHHRFPIRSSVPLYDSVKIPARSLVRLL